MEAVSGVFDEGDAALRAGERAREVIRTGSRVSVFLPHHGEILEAKVFEDTRSFWPVGVVSTALGGMGTVILATLGAPASYVLVWLIWAVVAGVMLAFWLTGEGHKRRMLRLRHEARSRLAREVEAGHPVVVAVVSSADEAHRVEQVFEGAGGKTHAPSRPFTE
jgi:hypothetical protein